MLPARHPFSHARELAFQGIYQLEVVDSSLEEVLELRWLNRPPAPEILQHCRQLITEAARNRSALDESIRAFAHKDFSQISAVVRSILRMAFLELMRAELPVAVIIDDMLELTRRYEGEEAVAFVNGILDHFAKSRKELDLES